jgi:transketolase
VTLRSQFAKTVIEIMEKDSGVVLALGDIGVHLFKAAFERWPDRCYNFGICESASVDVCAGLAMGGFYPIYSSIDSFVTRRAHEAIFIGFGLQRLPGMFITVGGGADYRRLGPTHMCENGAALMGQIPGMHIRMPVTGAATSAAISNAVSARQLSYIRLEESLAVALDDNVVPLHLGANGHAVIAGADG